MTLPAESSLRHALDETDLKRRAGPFHARCCIAGKPADRQPLVESSESSPTLKTIHEDTYTGFIEMSSNILINVCQDFLIARSGFVKRHDVDRYIAES